MLLDDQDHRIELTNWLNEALKAEREKTDAVFSKFAKAIRRDRETAQKAISELTEAVAKVINQTGDNNHASFSKLVETLKTQKNNLDQLETAVTELQIARKAKKGWLF